VTLAGGTVLVVGATGFLGRPLVCRLERLGARVIAAARSAPETIEPTATVVPWRTDAADPNQVADLFRATRPDVVFHLTSDGRGGRELELVAPTVRSDLLATVNVLTAAAQSPTPAKRFVMTGSLEEPPDGASAPVSPYAAAKAAASGYGRMFRATYDLDVRIVRPMMTYGPGQKDHKVVPSTILALLRGQAARVESGPRPVDWIYVDDVIEGMIQAALVPELAETVDLGSGALVTVADCAREISRQLGREDLLAIGDGGRGREIVRAADVDLAKRRLGFEAKTTLPQGLTQTILWYRARVQP
jgi:nucleoside-diphosphate-sugar epimerase